MASLKSNALSLAV